MMFYMQYDFNSDISNWDTGSVTTMRQMFYKAYAFDQDISAWDVSRVTDFADTFSSTTAMSADAAVCTRHNIQASWSSQSSFNQASWYNSACAR